MKVFKQMHAALAAASVPVIVLNHENGIAKRSSIAAHHCSKCDSTMYLNKLAVAHCPCCASAMSIVDKAKTDVLSAAEVEEIAIVATCDTDEGGCGTVIRASQDLLPLIENAKFSCPCCAATHTVMASDEDEDDSDPDTSDDSEDADGDDETDTGDASTMLDDDDSEEGGEGPGGFEDDVNDADPTDPSADSDPDTSSDEPDSFAGDEDEDEDEPMDDDDGETPGVTDTADSDADATGDEEPMSDPDSSPSDDEDDDKTSAVTAFLNRSKKGNGLLTLIVPAKRGRAVEARTLKVTIGKNQKVKVSADKGTSNLATASIKADPLAITLANQSATTEHHMVMIGAGADAKWFWFADNLPIAVATYKKADDKIKPLFATERFSNAFAIAAEDGVTNDIVKDFGFETLPTEVSVDDATKQAVESAVANAANQYNANLKEVSAHFQQCVGIAAEGNNKGLFNETENKLRASLVASLNKSGVKKADSIVNKAFADHARGWLQDIIAKAIELSEKKPESLNEIAAMVASSSYRFDSTASVDEQPSSGSSTFPLSLSGNMQSLSSHNPTEEGAYDPNRQRNLIAGITRHR